MRQIFILFTVTIIMLTACNPEPATAAITNTTSTPSHPPISTKTPISTLIETTPTALYYSSGSPLDRCLTIETNRPANSVSTGTLIFSSTRDIGNNLVRYTAYKINMATNDELEFSKPGENIFYVSISPDSKWMAYEKYVSNSKSSDLVVTDATGKQQVIIPWEPEWGYISSWLDTQRLLIMVISSSDEETPAAIRSSTFLVLNPFTNERQILQPDFPNIYESLGFTGLTGQGYNSELDRIVYLQGDLSFLEPLHYILWDIDHQRSLASFEVVIQPTAMPSWSPDGSKFALAASIKADILQTWPAYELYSISREGQVTQLTNLTDYFSWTYIDDYSWSPDGRHVAFWFSWWSKEENPSWDLVGERYLAIVDIENKVVTNYCIPAKLQGSGRAPLPVWSPDGRQVVIESPSSEGHSHVVLIDLENQLAIQIGEDMTPTGWMTAP